MAGALDNASAALRPGSPALARTLARAKALLVGRTASAFRDQARGGIAWPGRAVPNLPGVLADLARGPRVKEDRWTERPAGKDTGNLLKSVAGEILGGDTVQYGSKLDYASRFQRGEQGPPITITATMRENLVKYLQNLRGASPRSKSRAIGNGGRARKVAWLLAATKNKSGRSYAYKFQSITTKPRPRPFVLLTDQDRADVQKILVAEVRRAMNEKKG